MFCSNLKCERSDRLYEALLTNLNRLDNLLLIMLKRGGNNHKCVVSNYHVKQPFVLINIYTVYGSFLYVVYVEFVYLNSLYICDFLYNL